MSDRRLVRAATTGARVLVGGAVAAAVVVGTIAGIAAPWPGLVADPVRVEVTPAPSDTVLACDGPVFALGRTAESAGAVSVAAPQTTVSGPDTSAAETSALSGATADGSGDATVFRAPPRDRTATAYAAAGSATVASPDLIGFSASACRPPLAESWLVAGASTTGANDLVVLGNPGDVAATVQLTVYGAQGVSAPASGAGIVVPAGGQRVIPLAGLLLGEESPVVRVVATGAPVRASLQAGLTRVLLPGGSDQAAPLAQASTSLVIPGVQVVTASAGDAGTVLRLLAPGSATSATVTITPVGSGTPAENPRTLDLPAGTPTSLDLSSLAPGAYTVSIDAAQPVVGGVWSTTGFGAGADFAWYAPAPSFGSSGLVAVAPGAGAALVVATDAARGPASVTLTPPAGGAPVTVTVPAGGSATVPVGAGVYELSPDRPVHAAVSYAAPGALAGYPLWPADAAAGALTVLP
ncbi:MAG: large extracellular alpha-helical protein [Microbacterium sp. 71-36]|uniref:DUF5719 family protein n=1 Tax=unclassified Microbacterium TaxID=2609290 RepID=UPI00086EA657|nr:MULTISPECIES: DUF5719 family protein [unclassified Microbacterium]MBN9210053.1 large extracellular alpha-helical protein [Microbacterium sp.]ODT38182.1 MAG: large extracellular alpha-helical protein [Microbacterium sp. SCN 71-17]OJV76138.1 MAG: large extracellular alpha-helical protein [Microbacterium sp. 71-36]